MTRRFPDLIGEPLERMSAARDKGKPLPDPIRRQTATTATLGRYRGKVFSWSAGITCMHLARFHLKQMGHKPPTLPRFRSALAAKRALKEHGFGTVTELLDSLLPRIAPLAMTLGDLAVFPGDDSGLDGIVINAGGSKVFGWREDEPALVVVDVSVGDMTAAWRV